MLFMVVERFKDGDEKRIGERFKRQGRMMPAELVYHASWLDPIALRCFQLMEAPDRASFDAWVARWDDLMDFEIIGVEPSAEFWARRPVD